MLTLRSVRFVGSHRFWFGRFTRRGLAVVVLFVALLPAAFAQPVCPSPYLVQKGDSLSKIAQKCGVTLAVLRAANPQIVNPSKIEIGDPITIPGAIPVGDTTVNAAIQQELAYATYQLTASGLGEITLNNGQARRQTDIGMLGVDLIGPLAEGDLNQDGRLDAAAILLEQTANTTGRFYSLHALLDNGDTLSEAAALFLGDRIRINNMQIQAGGAIVIDLFIQGPNDPMAWASLHVVQTYRLQSGQLTLIAQLPVDDPVTPPAPTGAGCPNPYPTRLQKGGRAHVLPQPPTPNAVYNRPSKQAAKIGNIQPGVAMTLLDGPQCAEGRLWWYVRADSALVGWTSEGLAGEYWLGPGEAPGTTPGCVPAYSTRLQKGARATVLASPLGPNLIRNAPSKQGAQVGQIEIGGGMTLLDGPRCGDGWLWWYVQADSGGVGWTSEGQAGEYWLAPVNNPPALSFSGSWQTNFAQMTLTQSGNRVTGSYIRYGRQAPTALSGTVTGATLTGANEINTRFAFTLRADGQSFDGYWVGADGQARQWCGVRSRPLPAGCGFSGVWQATIGGNPGVMQLAQTGTTVTGTYNASGQQGQLSGHLGVERPGIAATEKMYSAYGQYQGGGYGGAFRFDLLNNESKQLQGCYLDSSNGNFGDWCGWRQGGAKPGQCLPIAACP